MRDIVAIALLHALLAGAAGAQRVEESYALRLPAPRANAVMASRFAPATAADGTGPTSAPRPRAADSDLVLLYLLPVTAGFLTGVVVDQAVCKRRHAGEPVIFLPPCYLYFGRATATGTIIGSVLGATASSALVAQRHRGCSARSAWLRAAGGAALGSLPSVLVTAGPPESGKWPLRRILLIPTSPMFTLAGAALATRGCTRRASPAISAPAGSATSR